MDISAKALLDGTFVLVGKGKAAKKFADAINKRRAAERAAESNNSLHDGWNGDSGSAADPKRAPRSAAALKTIIAIMEADGEPVGRYKDELAKLQRGATAPKEVTYAKAKRLAEEASRRLDKAAAKV